MTTYFSILPRELKKLLQMYMNPVKIFLVTWVNDENSLLCTFKYIRKIINACIIVVDSKIGNQEQMKSIEQICKQFQYETNIPVKIVLNDDYNTYEHFYTLHGYKEQNKNVLQLINDNDKDNLYIWFRLLIDVSSKYKEHMSKLKTDLHNYYNMHYKCGIKNQNIRYVKKNTIFDFINRHNG